MYIERYLSSPVDEDIEKKYLTVFGASLSAQYFITINSLHTTRVN